MIVPQNHWEGWCDTRVPLEEETFKSLNPVWPPINAYVAVRHWPASQKWAQESQGRGAWDRMRAKKARAKENEAFLLLLKLELFQIQTHISKRIHNKTSLVAQWLKIHASTAGGVGSIPGQGTRFHKLCRTQPKKKNYTYAPHFLLYIF